MTASEVSLRTAGTRLSARSVAVDREVDLLGHYTADGFAWLDGDRGFVASGIVARVAPVDAAAFLASIEHSCDDVSSDAGPRAVGALPFSGAGDLIVPARIVGRDADGRTWQTVIDGAEPTTTVEADLTVSRPPSEYCVTALTTRDEWRTMVESALAAIRTGALLKVVLARAVSVEGDQPFDLAAVLGYLRRSQPGCTIYADRGFVGASPELLVRKRGASVVSRPLAGTGTDTAALLRSAKDAHEHRFVVDAVVHALHSLGTGVEFEGPLPLELADVSHLATTVTATVEPASVTVADVVAALHPTPAVAGAPRDTALAEIAALEPSSRGCYAGPCGWIDRHGDGEFVVALRGGTVDGTRALLHAGAGIVAGSDPELEWTETQQKLTPMLQALVRP